MTHCTGEAFVVLITAEDFTRLRDGAEIVVKREVDEKTINRFVVGRLDKRSILTNLEN